jgi:hypothetical protein
MKKFWARGPGSSVSEARAQLTLAQWRRDYPIQSECQGGWFDSFSRGCAPRPFARGQQRRHPGNPRGLCRRLGETSDATGLGSSPLTPGAPRAGPGVAPAGLNLAFCGSSDTPRIRCSRHCAFPHSFCVGGTSPYGVLHWSVTNRRVTERSDRRRVLSILSPCHREIRVRNQPIDLCSESLLSVL